MTDMDERGSCEKKVEVCLNGYEASVECIESLGFIISDIQRVIKTVFMKAHLGNIRTADNLSWKRLLACIPTLEKATYDLAVNRRVYCS